MSTLQTLPVAGAPREIVATQIRMLLARDRRTQAELALVLGISQSQLSKRLRGVIPLDLDELVKVADFFKVSVGNLFGEDTQRRPDGPDEGQRARRYSKPQPSDPKVLPLRIAA